jgi:hypothetical protein
MGSLWSMTSKKEWMIGRTLKGMGSETWIFPKGFFLYNRFFFSLAIKKKNGWTWL